MSELTLNFGTDEHPGEPGVAELRDAINHICADIGPTADSLVVAYDAGLPATEELSHTLNNLRDLVGDIPGDYLINFGTSADWGPDARDFPSAPELRLLLVAIAASV